MNCKRVRRLFSMRLDGDLCYEEQREFDNHLGGCPACATEMLRLERTVGLVRDLPIAEPSAGFVDGILARVRQSGAEPGAPERIGVRERLGGFLDRLAWSVSPQVAVAALALGIVVGGGLGLLILPGENASPMAEQVLEAPLPGGSVPSGAGVASSPDETPVPGSLSDLVDQMMQRMESPVPVADSTGAAAPDWSPSRDLHGSGQQVGAEPVVRRDGERGSRVYVVF